MKKSYVLSLLAVSVLSFLVQITVDLNGNFTVSSGDTAPIKDTLGNLVQSLWSVVQANSGWVIGFIAVMIILSFTFSVFGGRR